MCTVERKCLSEIKKEEEIIAKERVNFTEQEGEH
jgi:hypothetical protein